LQTSGRSTSLAIDIASVPRSVDGNKPFLVIDIVENSIGPDAQPPARPMDELDSAWRPGVVFERLYGREDPAGIRFLDSPQFPSDAAIDPDLIAGTHFS